MDKPDYPYLRRMFKELAHRNEIELDGVYDWDILDQAAQQGMPALPPVEEADAETSMKGERHGESLGDDADILEAIVPGMP